ncbi:MAG TPA: hypothetical protein VN513_05235 [Gemmatimonadales bacterium]|nr:hypothetical protein [Gemmatimonadales bacterium]
MSGAPAESTKDPLAIGIGSLGAGIGFGSAVMSAAQIITAILRDYRTTDPVTDPASKALTAGLLLAIGLGGGLAWYRSFPLDNIWQRGVIAVLGALGALLVGFLGAPMYRWINIPGLAAWVLIGVIIGILGNRWAIRGRGAEGL